MLTRWTRTPRSNYRLRMIFNDFAVSGSDGVGCQLGLAHVACMSVVPVVPASLCVSLSRLEPLCSCPLLSKVIHIECSRVNTLSFKRLEIFPYICAKGSNIIL